MICLVGLVSSHGRFIEPPSRTSAWRFGFKTPTNHIDHGTNCGGFGRQWQKNKGKCGVCGDAWDLKTPRAAESGGRYGRDVIVRSYSPGQMIEVGVEVTANHMGYFQFSPCPFVPASQKCFETFRLKSKNGKTKFHVRRGTGKRYMKVKICRPRENLKLYPK